MPNTGNSRETGLKVHGMNPAIWGMGMKDMTNMLRPPQRNGATAMLMMVGLGDSP